MFKRIRESRIARILAVFMSLNMLIELVGPLKVFALTGGPSQPEVESFEPIGTTDMVDLFSGDFVYNIPLLDVGGYPINLSYHSGVTMDQEASWVGLGWNLNPGVINRNMRGIPDDFDGEIIKKEFNMKPNRTYGAKIDAGIELLGYGQNVASPSFSMGIGVNYNNYTGLSLQRSYSAFLSISQSSSPVSANLGFNVSTSTEDGMTIAPSLSLSAKMKSADMGLGASIGTAFNTREGLKQLTFGKSVQIKQFNRNFSSSMSFANPTYIPKIDIVTKTSSMTFGTRYGFDLYGSDVTVDGTGFYTETVIEESDKIRRLPAYGYIYSRSDKENAVLDFNREKDLPFSHHLPNLPLTNFTFDTYSIVGQGVGGMMRGFRKDLGYVFDPYTSTKSGSDDMNIEISTGANFHIGAQYDNNEIKNESGIWRELNPASSILQFKNSKKPVYFKNIGEMSADIEDGFFDKTGGFDPVRIPITSYTDFMVAADPLFTKETLLNAPSEDFPLASIPTGDGDFPVSRNTSILTLTKEDVSHGLGFFGNDASNHLDMSLGQNSHIWQINVTNTDGSRYVYAIPAYNTKQREVTFSVAATPSTTGLVGFDSSDPTTSNNKGKDNYYSATEIPAYVHSYLLTAVLSADYIDSDDIPGPSADDLGSYTVFNYENITKNNDNSYVPYRWRVPYEYNMGNYNEGLKTESNDDKASYVYGEKELYYLESISTKTQVAVFSTSRRNDGYEAKGEKSSNNGAVKSMKQLDKISLYSMPDYKQNINNLANAHPIKVVNFDYADRDEELCKNIPNTGSDKGNGKLTLKKLYFTYGHSFKGKLNPYKFSYAKTEGFDTNTNNGEDPYNPYYALKDYDRWGYYKPNNPSYNALNNAEFPYVKQNKDSADLYSAAWSLTDIYLPSGGKIKVDYESDDYAYVQDRKAMQMFVLKGAGSSAEGGFNNKLYNGGTNNLYLYFDLPTIPQDDVEFYNMYIKELVDKYKGYVYFKCLVDLMSGNSEHEYVEGYAEISTMPGTYGIYDTNKGFIMLNSVKREGGVSDGGDHPENPISKAAWQFSRIYTPRKANGFTSTGGDDGNVNAIMGELLSTSFLNQLNELVSGANGMMKNKGFGKYFIPEKSWIRLMNPDGKKLGGGSRVKKVLVYDSWLDMVEREKRSYAFGQEYDYTTEKGISSGVASYEPLIGGEENPFRQPVFYGGPTKLLVPDDEHYLEEPFGEDFFPSAAVGYSRVVVKNLGREDVNDGTNISSIEGTTNTGYTINEFYTAKDFPVVTKQTLISKIQHKTALMDMLFDFLNVEVQSYMTASQGYSIELNDMHGKPKSTTIVGNNQIVPISQVEYYYNTTPTNKLDNNVDVISKTGSLDTKRMGVDYDVIVDLREYKTTTESMGTHANVNASSAGPLLIVIPTAWPNSFWSEDKLHTAVVTKVINRTGILQSIMNVNFGSSISTTNLKFDQETGEVLLTMTTDEYNDKTFSLNYPAHWAYEGMGQAYKNEGSNKVITASVSGNITSGSSGLVAGDEIIDINTGIMYWVIGPNYGIYKLIDRYGSQVTNATISGKIVRSGRRNQQNIPIGTVISKSNPAYGAFTFATNPMIIGAGATEYAEGAALFCECESGNPIGSIYNPYLRGVKGTWHPLAKWQFLTSRTSSASAVPYRVDVRTDGAYAEGFTPFWNKPASSSFWAKNEEGWMYDAKATIYSPYGFELENVDPINRNSAAVYGYNNIFPMGTASNSKYKEIATDNFEEYEFDNCPYDHFSFEPNLLPNPDGNADVTISGEQSHTGRQSIRLGIKSSIKYSSSTGTCD